VKHAHREIMNHQRLLHPHVVQLKEVFAAKPFLALVMEFVPNGDMFQASGGSAGSFWQHKRVRLAMRHRHR
jgi:serine/threonine-protein kinase SRK2